MFELNEQHDDEMFEDLEQRLKATAPQSPELDVAALMREASDPVVDRHNSIAQRSLWMAASWGCGASIGAAVMFVLMSGVAKETEHLPTNETIARPVLSEAANDTFSPAKQEPSDPIGLGSMLAFNLLNDEPTGLLSDRETLQVGMYLRRNMQRVSQPVPAYRQVQDSEDHQEEEPSTSASLFVPSPPMTRERQMRELLEETGGAT